MKRILIIGNSPLPDENVKCRPAAGLRTYQFLQPLLKRSDDAIAMVNIAMPECYDSAPQQKETRHSYKYTQLVISKNDPSIIKKIQALHDEFHPDAIIGVNTYPSFIASQIHSPAPFWADLNGWIMAEAQAQAHKMDSNDYIPHYYDMEKNIVKWADKFSTVSQSQEFSLLGELASLGRLNKETFGYQFVHHIPNGTEWFAGEEEIFNRGTKKSFPEMEKIPDDAFVLLWMGGYNTWVDENTLFKGVEDAMKQCAKLYFVSTGGEIAGLDNKTFASFKEMIEKSAYKDRFIFLGWVEVEDIPYIYKMAQCGLNVDKKCVETLTGARNRINEMMKFGLPVITTFGSEISYEVARIGAGLGVAESPKGSAFRYELLAEAIMQMYKEWRGGGDRETAQFEKYSVNGRKYIEEECNYEKLMKPLMQWLDNPRPSPDRNTHVKLSGITGGIARMKGGVRYLKERGAKKFLKKIL